MLLLEISEPFCGRRFTAASSAAAPAGLISRERRRGNIEINHFTASIAETPFGGKDSDYGREGGIEGLQCYTLTKTVSYKIS